MMNCPHKAAAVRLGRADPVGTTSMAATTVEVVVELTALAAPVELIPATARLLGTPAPILICRPTLAP